MFRTLYLNVCFVFSRCGEDEVHGFSDPSLIENLKRDHVSSDFLHSGYIVPASTCSVPLLSTVNLVTLWCSPQVTAPVIREFLTLMAVCHTVVPENKNGDPNAMEYQASSPGTVDNVFYEYFRADSEKFVSLLTSEDTRRVVNILF